LQTFDFLIIHLNNLTQLIKLLCKQLKSLVKIFKLKSCLFQMIDLIINFQLAQLPLIALLFAFRTSLAADCSPCPLCSLYEILNPELHQPKPALTLQPLHIDVPPQPKQPHMSQNHEVLLLDAVQLPTRAGEL
jgi:hypothetical protein